LLSYYGILSTYGVIFITGVVNVGEVRRAALAAAQ